MSPTVFLLSDRPAFESAWKGPLVDAGMDVRALHPDALVQAVGDGRAVVFDAGSSTYDEDELLASVGLARALRTVVAVVLPDQSAFAGVEDLLDDLCAGLVLRPGDDVKRAASMLARRRDASRGKRFEYLTVSPRPNELLAVLGDGACALLPRPIGEQDDGSEIASITLAPDARAATLELGSGRELVVEAVSLLAANGSKASHASGNGHTGTIAIDGAKLGARLRALRQAAGLTQAELARRTGIHRPNIARVEAGRHTPSLETLARLASAIGVSTTLVLAED